ncbi:MAG: protein-(glutamine-N5) methyltransferase, release factor-specific [Chloroflexi bacterium GWB2_54_36]|nr:MAG: protein-(glutamine-N5) methyltransferase, release factor-specific [Chloroflexi bacterium GWB2_54_36]
MARQRLTGVEQPGLEAQLILGSVLQLPRAAVLAHLERRLTPGQLEQLAQLVNRRANGEPLPYLLEHWEFFGLDLVVTPAVLIPRPETELLVEEALAWLKQHPSRRQAADVGVGSGAISAALATHIPDLRICATDHSRPALRVAQENMRRLGLTDRVSLLEMDLLSACRGPFDLVAANLPYIPSKRLVDLQVARFEPADALDGGNDGLRLIERLLAAAPRWLAPDGQMLLEIEAGQGESAPALARKIFPYAEVDLKTDLAGLPRLLRIVN